MMKNLIIEAVPDSPYYPEVKFDASTGICELIGESYMEEAYKFYTPLLNWLKEFCTTEKRPLLFNVRLTYFNTNSSRLLLDLLDILKKYSDNGGDVSIVWYYDPEDADVKEEVEDFELETGLSISMKPMEID